jgi:hypothetical protein
LSGPSPNDFPSISRSVAGSKSSVIDVPPHHDEGRL